MRECGECTLCCKLLQIDVLDKPANQWCKHCIPMAGCSIYKDRPQTCVKFRCMWLAFPEEIPEEMFPWQVRFLMAYNSKDKILNVVTVAERPHAWRAHEKFIKALSTNGSVRIVSGQTGFFLSGGPASGQG